MLSVFIAFLAGSMDSIMQASSSLIGAMTGPLLAVFVVGVMVPFVRRNGAAWGVCLGLAFSWWLTLGSIIYPRMGDDLPVSNAQCLAPNVTLIEKGSFNSPLTPEGILAFYHISFIWISAVGFVVTLILSVLISALFGECVGKKIRFALEANKKKAKTKIKIKEKDVIKTNTLASRTLQR